MNGDKLQRFFKSNDHNAESTALLASVMNTATNNCVCLSKLILDMLRIVALNARLL
jgi:hypothetical protein